MRSLPTLMSTGGPAFPGWACQRPFQRRGVTAAIPQLGYTCSFPDHFRSFHCVSTQERDSSMASPALDFARQNQQRFVSELKDLLRIPSVSTLEEHKSDVQKAA